MDSKQIEIGSRFIASTMHEVRTPLQTIIGTLELLEETPLNAEQMEYIHQIEFSANALLGLANDVLDFTKITNNNFRLEPAPFDIVELVENVVDLVSSEAFAKGLEVIINIDYNIPHTVVGDAVRIQQIILNLVKNAVKFTDRGFIMVRVKKVAESLSFEIIDSGIGIAEDKKDKIFNDFYQVDGSAARRFSGTGLGLSICKNLVHIMKGEIGVLSNPEGGSNFYFTVPLCDGDMKIQNRNDIPGIEGEKILVLDDSSLAASVLKEKLHYFGAKKVDCVSTGESCIRQIEHSIYTKDCYTIIFIDLNIPDTNIWNLAEQIRNSCSASTKIILMIPEGRLKQDAKLKLTDIFAGYIYKPIKYKSMLSVLLENISEKVKKIPDEMQAPETEKQVTSILDEQIGAGLKILVAEDQAVNLKLLVTFLKKYGAEVYTAPNGEEAVRQIEEHPDTDIIFMDIFMPVKSGIDATIELRRNGYKGVIIACTANNDPEDFKAYKEIGITDIMVKPFKKAAVKNHLEKWNSFLSISNAKDILSITYIKEKINDIWDMEDFMDTVGGNSEFASSLMQEYLEQVDTLMENLKFELSRSEKDFRKIELYTHTLKGSSASVSATRFAKLGRKMNEAAKKRDLLELETARINFELDFISFKSIIKNWI